MKKKRQKRLLVFLAITLIFSLLVLAACVDPSIEEEDKKTEETTEIQNDGTLINNGSFKFAKPKDPNLYLQTEIVNWTKNDGSFKSTDSKVKMGVIELDKALFDEKKSLFNFTSSVNSENKYSLSDFPEVAPSTPKDDKGAYTDKNAMIISMPDIDKKQGSVYFSLSNSSTLAKDSFYKLSIDVYTDLFNPEDKSGAAIEITSTMYSQILSINTEKTWKTYSFYIATNKYVDATFNLKLWLGHGPEYLGQSTNPNPHLAAGSVLYDNVFVEKITSDTEINNIRSAYKNGEYKDNENGKTRYMDLSLVDPGFNAITDYSSTYSSSSNDYYYSAKRGIQSQYEFKVGDKKLTTDEKNLFPDYPTYTSSRFPIGVFDMSKLYSVGKNDDGVDVATDKYQKIDSTFVAPKDYEHFMKKDKDGNWNYNLHGNVENGRTGEEDSVDSTALLVWHPSGKISGAGYVGKNKITIEKDKYYDISVWVYIWIPKTEKPKDLTEDEEKNPAKVKEYEEKLDTYNKYQSFYNRESKAQALFKVSGASVTDSDKLLSYSNLDWGKWEKLTIKIKGNSLSKREITPEFWYGHGYWGDSTLMPGAAFFDDLSVSVRDEVEPSEEDDYYELSILSEGDFKGFGLTETTEDFVELEKAEGKVWEYKRVDDKKLGVEISSKNSIAGKVSGNSSFINSPTPIDGVVGLEGISKGPGTLKIKYSGGAYRNTDLLVLNHKGNDTASSISFLITQKDIDVNADLQDLLLVRPNNFYRFSFWINTEGIPSNMGAKVKILQIDSEDETKTSELATFSGINVNEWTEYIAYIKGAETEKQRFGFEIVLGEGDIAVKEDTRTAGVVFFTAPTWQKISNEEYNDANKNLNTTKDITARDNTSSKSSSFTNGFFKNFDSSEYKNTEKFNKEGYLTKEVKPTSWQYNEAAVGLEAVKSFKVEGTNKLTWEKVEGATQYYVYMNEYEKKEMIDGVEKTLKKNDILVDIIDDPTTTYQATRNGKYYIRAAGAHGSRYDETAYGFVFSPKTSVLNITGAGTGNFPADRSDEDKLKTNHGIINYKYYDGLGYADEETAIAGMYGNSSNGDYVSQNSDNLLMISSPDSEVTALYKYNSTYTISKGSYYLVSLWVKTEGAETKASVTLEDNSSTLVKKDNGNKGEYAGFTDINTDGKWVQYRILINTGYVDGRVTLELALGNKYAKDSEGNEDNKLGLSKGTVYFDDVNIKKLESQTDFNLHAYGLENIKDKTPEDYKIKENELYTLSEISELKLPYSNQAIHTIVDYRVDSFDSSSDANDDYLGRKPGAYTHHQPAGSIPYQKPTGDEIPSILNGVYSTRSLTEQIRGKISQNFTEEDSLFYIDKLNAFLGTNNGNGSNFLMMVNIESNGQYYEMTSGFDIEPNKYYKISFYAKLLSENNKKAQFRFMPGKDMDNNTKTIEISGEELKEYTFYVYSDEKNSTISSNKIAFHLGTNDGIGKADDATDVKDFFKGMLIVDDVAIEEIDMTEEKFAEAIEKEMAYKFDPPKENEPDAGAENEEPITDNTKGKVDSQLWLLVSSIVIAAILIIALAIVGYRKLKTRFAKGQKIIVKSKVPTDLEQEVKQSKKDTTKGDVDDSEFDD